MSAPRRKGRYPSAAFALAAQRERQQQRRKNPPPPNLMPLRRAGRTIANRGCKPDTASTLKMYELYQAGKSLAEVGAAFGIRRQGVWDRFKRASLKMRSELLPKNNAKPFIEFQGARYAPDGKDNYFRKTHGDRSLLHWDIWEAKHGKIGPGHEVRFVDGDRLNIVLENLVCVRKGQGRSLGRVYPTLKPCLFCGQTMLPKLGRRHPEPPSAYRLRQTCDAQCSASWKRGRRRGELMPKMIARSAV